MFHRKKPEKMEEEVEVTREEIEGIKRELKRVEKIQKILEKEGMTTKTELLLSKVSFRLFVLSRDITDFRSEFRAWLGIGLAVLVALLLFLHPR